MTTTCGEKMGTYPIHLRAVCGSVTSNCTFRGVVILHPKVSEAKNRNASGLNLKNTHVLWFLEVTVVHNHYQGFFQYFAFLCVGISRKRNMTYLQNDLQIHRYSRHRTLPQQSAQKCGLELSCLCVCVCFLLRASNDPTNYGLTGMIYKLCSSNNNQ